MLLQRIAQFLELLPKASRVRRIVDDYEPFVALLLSRSGEFPRFIVDYMYVSVFFSDALSCQQRHKRAHISHGDHVHCAHRENRILQQGMNFICYD